MVDWYLNPALSTLRKEVNTRWPKRDKGSDGTIGDKDHQARTSDHNADPDGSVDAWDMDVELNGIGQPFAEDVEFVIAQFEKHKASKYWIYNDIIARRDNGWKREPYANYGGPDRNRHTRHVHLNSREEYESSTDPWGILEGQMDVNLEQPIWTAPANHPSGVPAGVRKFGAILTALDTRSALLTNGNFVGKQVAKQTETLMTELNKILAAALDDGNTTVVLDAAALVQLEKIKASIEALPEQVAVAVDTELEQALQGAID